MAKEFRHIGKETPRMAAHDYVTGRAKYIRDMKRPGMLYGKVLRSPYPYAIKKRIDTSKAEKLPGVRAILTHENAPDWVVGALVPGIPQVSFFDEKVRYVGDAVALVAAETGEIAEEALDLIEVDYEQLPAVFDMEEAVKGGAPPLYAEYPENVIPNSLIEKYEHNDMGIDIGDVEKGLKEADIIVEGSARVENAQNPLPPEAAGVIAEWEGKKLTEWGSFSSPGLALLSAQPAMKLASGDLRLIPAYVGGSYGSKHIDRNNYIMLYAAALAKVARRPVALFYNKEEHFASYQIRMPGRARYKVGMKKDGTVTAITGEWLNQCGSVSTLQSLMVAVGLIAFPFLAKCSNVKINTKLVLTNTTPSGPYRGFGYLENTALLSPILAMAMEKADLDPVEYYKKNCIKPGDKFIHPYMAKGWEVSVGPDIAPAIEKASEVFGWKKKWKGWGKPTAANGARRSGVGIGATGQPDVGEQKSTSNVQLNAFGSVTVYCCATEFGTGTRDVIHKIAAEALDMPLERVNLTDPDTMVGPWEWGSTGSRSTYAMGSAVLAATEDAKQKLFQRAAPMLQVKPEELGTKDGMVFVKGQRGKMLPWIAVMGWQGSITGVGHFPERTNLPVYQVQFVDVEVDIETGAVELQNLVATTDCGKVVNPLGFQGQLHGFLGGAGLALREETVMDKATGRTINASMIDYKTYTFNELPTYQSLVFESQTNADPPCPFGAFGAGELSMSPAPAAVCMAIYNAIGKRILDYPITPQKILKALGRA